MNKDSCIDRLTAIEEWEMDKVKSNFGNNCLYITPADIGALRSGKVLYYDDEYCTFKCLKGD